jgi:hypothetical protein
MDFSDRAPSTPKPKHTPPPPHTGWSQQEALESLVRKAGYNVSMDEYNNMKCYSKIWEGAPATLHCFPWGQATRE